MTDDPIRHLKELRLAVTEAERSLEDARAELYRHIADLQVLGIMSYAEAARAVDLNYWTVAKSCRSLVVAQQEGA